MLVDGSFKSLMQGISQQPDRSRLDGQCTEMKDMIADSVDGLRRRPPYSMIKNIGAYHADNLWYDYDTGLEAYTIVFGYDKSVQVFDLEGTQKTVNNQGASYLTTTPKIDLRMTTIGDYTIVANNQKDTAMKSDIHAKTSAALIFFRDGGEYGRTYDVIVDGLVYATYVTPGGANPATEAAQTGTSYVASQLYTQLIATGLPTVYSIELNENVILMKRLSGTSLIDLQVSDDRGNKFAIIVQEETEGTDELPLYAEPGMVTTIVGDGLESTDDFYMEATGTGTGLQPVVWRETVARDITYLLDEDTMPHALVRLSDGTFYFGPLDGSTTGGTTLETWRERAAGDEDSNPERAFIGYPIEFVTSFQERLVMLSRDFELMSATNSYFNFWNKTATALLDTDPIELANPATKATFLKTAIQHNQNLITFSDDTQFITKGSTGITPATAAMTIASSFKADLTAVPIASGANVFFGITYGNFAGIRELFTTGTTAAQDSRKITEHVKRLLPGNVTRMIDNSNLGMLVTATSGSSSKLYLYQYLWEGSDRLQAAWSYFEFGTSEIVHFFFSGSDLYLVLKDLTEYTLVNIDMTNEDETGLDFNVYLDRKERITPVAKVFTIVDQLIPESSLVVVQADDSDYPGMTVQVESVVAGVITLKEDPGGDVIFGRTFTSRYTPTMPLIKDENGVAITTNPLLINTFVISYKDTGRFKVDLNDTYLPSTEQEYTGRIIGGSNNVVGEIALNTGAFVVGVHKDRDVGEVSIYTESHLPLSLIDIEWTGQFTKTGRRF